MFWAPQTSWKLPMFDCEVTLASPDPSQTLTKKARARRSLCQSRAKPEASLKQWSFTFYPSIEVKPLHLPVVCRTPFFVDKCLSALSSHFLSPEHSVEEEVRSLMQSPILAPAESPWGWSPGSGSASSDNRSTSVRTPSQQKFAFDGNLTLTFSLTPSDYLTWIASRQTESRKRARGPAARQAGKNPCCWYILKPFRVWSDEEDKILTRLSKRKTLSIMTVVAVAKCQIPLTRERMKSI